MGGSRGRAPGKGVVVLWIHESLRHEASDDQGLRKNLREASLPAAAAESAAAGLSAVVSWPGRRRRRRKGLLVSVVNGSLSALNAMYGADGPE